MDYNKLKEDLYKLKDYQQYISDLVGIGFSPNSRLFNMYDFLCKANIRYWKSFLPEADLDYFIFECEIGEGDNGEISISDDKSKKERKYKLDSIENFIQYIKKEKLTLENN